MWHLVSTWQRDDGSVTMRYVGTSGGRWRGWVRDRRAAIRRARRDRSRRRDEERGLTVGGRIVDAIAPIAERHGLVPADPQVGDSVVWCSPATEVRLRGRDETDDPRACVDLWVHVDRERRSIAVDFEGDGLAEFVSGRSHWDGPIDIELDADIDRSLMIIAEHLDRLCDAVIVGDV